MNEELGHALQTLMNYNILVFQRSRNDRAKLHEIEFEADESTPWVSIEMKIIADSVAGIAHSCTKARWRKDMTKEEAIDFLKSQSIFFRKDLVNWIGTEGPNFPDFLGYMLSTECVRVAAIKFLKDSKFVAGS